MIKFISDYIKLGFGFCFKECEKCGQVKVLITKLGSLDDIVGVYTSSTCINKKLFKNEDELIAELSEEMYKISLRDNDIL